MDKWDEEKLRNVVLSKHGNPRTTTDVGSAHILLYAASYYMFRLSANTLSKLSKLASASSPYPTPDFSPDFYVLIVGSAGSGNVQTVKSVNTDTHYQPVSC
jgi:hypothetical protein